MGLIERSGFSIYYEVVGPHDGRPLVLVAGLGEQIGSVEYPDEQCDLFVSHGFRVVRLDNRDTGLSVPTEPIDLVDLEAVGDRLAAGEGPEPGPYSRADMAGDVVSVLDELGIEQADLLGASMGGYIVREVAVSFPERVSALTVVMSGSGALRGEEGPQLGAGLVPGLAEMARSRNREETIEFLVKQWRWMWGSDYEFDKAWVKKRVSAAFDRGHYPEGIARQVVGGVLCPGLWEAQRSIACPTLVIHGAQDPIFDLAHARAVSEQIRGAHLWVDPRMGHVMHREQWPEMAERTARLAG